MGMDQAQVALVANVSERVVHQIEHGKPTSRLDVLMRVLDAVGMDLRAVPRRLVD